MPPKRKAPPKSASAASRRSTAVAKSNAQPKYTLLEPTETLQDPLREYLLNPPSQDNDVQRPSKRQRVHVELLSDENAIVVSTSTIEIDLVTSSLSNQSPLTRHKLPLQIDIGDASSLWSNLDIFDRSGKSPQHLLRVPLASVRAISDDARIAALVTSDQFLASNPEGQGRLWADVDVGVDAAPNSNLLTLHFTVKWNATTFGELQTKAVERKSLLAVMNRYFPDPEMRPAVEKWSPQDFYQSVHVPEASEQPPAIAVPNMETELYPFQQRALRWLLHREGVAWSDSEQKVVAAPRKDASQDLPHSFFRVETSDGTPCYASHLFRLVTKDIEPFKQAERATKGGILSEEMGLGKTVETIALILSHRREDQSGPVFDMYSLEEVKSTSATLIITPPSIVKQWQSELQRHAPNLKVIHYEGLRNTKGINDHPDFAEYLASHDVVLTTYNVVASEIYYGSPPPDRSMRQSPKYERPKSPLKQLSWWRVCLDEAQMVESGVSNAARVAQTLPRINAWGITGTPVKRNVADLFGLLVFLRHEPYKSFPHYWTSLIKSHKPAFSSLFKSLAMRHTKQLVRDELKLPPQRRVVITMPFTPIEEQHYQNLFQQMAEECGLDTSGAPIQDGWNPNDPKILEKMRSWLVRLRQSALHPEIGGNKKVQGNKNRPLRTALEVLDTMIEQSDSAIRLDQRNLFLSKLKRGQVLENGPRVKEALGIWTEVLEETTALVDECRELVRTELQASKQDLKEHSADEPDSADDVAEAVEVDPQSRLGMCRTRLRHALELQHIAVFFQASAYFQIRSDEAFTKPGSLEFSQLEKREADGYARAKAIRQDILADILEKAMSFMRRISRKASSQSFVVIPEFAPAKGNGIESRSVFAQLDKLSLALDVQAQQVDEWRETVVQFLLQPLLDDEEGAENTGEEYDSSTQTQDKIMAYVQVLKIIVADRNQALTGMKNHHVEVDVKTAKRLARHGKGPYPEKMLELLQIRDQMKPAEDLGSVRAIVAELRRISTNLNMAAEHGSTRAQNELVVIEREKEKVNEQITIQNEAVLGLEKEVELFTSSMNARMEYYRQLQHVSDCVLLYEGPKDEATYNKMLDTEKTIQRRISTGLAKHRYLIHLKSEEGRDAEEQRYCLICTSHFTVGSLTVCGHAFCKDCLLKWWHEHHKCPTCNRRLTHNDIHDITYKPQELQVQQENTPTTAAEPYSPSKQKSGIYTEISTSTLAQINSIDIEGPSFTTKVDTLVRHLIWLRGNDPDAKSIIFSQFSGFLKILERAFKKHRIGYASMDKTGDSEKFKKDPACQVFLLHARHNSSGMNLVNASHVFLCEPVLNTPLELQAIARVDRIGQESATTVWLYLVDGTVEESIYEIGVARRMEHVRKGGNKSNAVSQSEGESPSSSGAPNTPAEHEEDVEMTDAEEVDDESFEADNAKQLEGVKLGAFLDNGQRGGEAVDDKDLWPCLFGNVKKNRKQESEAVQREAARGLRAEAAEARAAAAAGPA